MATSWASASAASTLRQPQRPPGTPSSMRTSSVCWRALKNADKVNEIVANLRGAGYHAFTSPSTPVQGKITRILVGPDTSKDKLKGQLGDLKQISGLSGVVMGYSPN